MRKCGDNNMQEWGFDAIFDVTCPQCGHVMEFFRDEITRTCTGCWEVVRNPRPDYGCNQCCSSSSAHARNLCRKFIRSKQRFLGNYI